MVLGRPFSYRVWIVTPLTCGGGLGWGVGGNGGGLGGGAGQDAFRRANWTQRA